MLFKPAHENLFFKSHKPGDSRLGEKVKLLRAEDISKIKNAFVIAGYADDEGILNNSGRVGARLAPEKIREYFYKMTPANDVDLSLYDLGDLETQKIEIGDRHKNASSAALQVMRNNCRWIALGGGHDYGYADVSAFIRSCDQKPLIINFDAHLDVRSTEMGINSGTPFYRVLEEFPEIDLVQIGIQSQCNSPAHFKYAAGKDVQILRYDDLRLSGEDLTSYCVKRIGHLITKRRKCFLSIDMDGFSNAFAPGCSQSFATGLEPNEFFQLLSMLARRLQIQGIGIYECSPPLDLNDHTSKLAALILHKFIFSGEMA